MSERKFDPGWDLFRARVSGVRIRAEFAADRVINEARFRGRVSSEKRRQASELAADFGAEALAFLEDNLTQRLSPLYPTKSQLEIFRLLMDSVDSGGLKLGSVEGRLDGLDRPFIARDYSVGEIKIENLLDRKFVCLIIRWGVEDPFPHGFGIFGFLGRAMPRTINFITFPRKPETAAEVQKMMGPSQLRDGSRLRVGLFNDGKRIILNRDSVYKGKDIAITSQYYLIGGFDGQVTKKTYWLYGCNNEHDSRKTVSPRVRVPNLVGEKTRG